MKGRRFLDLFAGTGAYGLEALSRGAGGGVFVERSRQAAAVLRENLASVTRGFGGESVTATVHCRDVLSWRPGAGERADLVFADPPYGMLPTVLPRLGERLEEFVLPGAEPLLILEVPGEASVQLPGWRCVKTLGKGRLQPTCGIWVMENG